MCVCVDLFLKQEGIVRDIVGELDVTCFQTSIWDETLYRAWSQVYLCGGGGGSVQAVYGLELS